MESAFGGLFAAASNEEDCWIDIKEYIPEEGTAYDMLMPGAKLTALYIGKDGQWQSSYTQYLYTTKQMLRTGYTHCKRSNWIGTGTDNELTIT